MATTAEYSALGAVVVRRLLRDIQDEHGGVTQHEHPEAGIPGTRECGDVHGVAGMLTLAALRAVGAAGCSW
jgi:hypothetical protein